MTHIYDTICYGGTYEDEFFKESKSGVYSHTEKVGECEQIFVLHLFAEENLERSYVSDSVCYGGTYSKYGFNIQSSVVGERKDSLLLTNRYGCDSILYLDLTVLPMKRDTLRKSVCKNQSYEDGDFFVPAYQSCGVNFYEKINTDVNTGCVSRLVLELRVDTVYQRSLVDSICLNEIYKRDGFDITATKEGFNNYYRTLSSQNGCDSILALNLKVFDTSETVFFDTIVVGSPYKNFGFDLAPQYSMGMKQYIRHQENENKCDSVITLNLMIVSDEDSLFVPTAFTPQNGNGVNDVFMEGYEIYVYDRYGLLVCHSLNGWDGRYAGKMADAGVYVYTLIYKSGSKKSGTVEIFKE